MAPAEVFAGEVAGNYAKYRRGYRAELLETLASRFALGPGSRVLDLGCGTGQLARPLADRAGSVIGMDPSADMLSLALEGTTATNATWLLGTDEQVPGLESLLGKECLDLVTIGQALHWMDAADLFTALVPLLRPRGGIAVIANGVPVWLQETPWARAIVAVSRKWFGELTFPSCGTSDEDRARYRDLLESAGYTVGELCFPYGEAFTTTEVIGSFYSAAPLEKLSAAQRPEFDRDLRTALEAAQPDGRFVEHVDVRVLLARQP
jgi:trans-aconitate methyltransferase